MWARSNSSIVTSMWSSFLSRKGGAVIKMESVHCSSFLSIETAVWARCFWSILLPIANNNSALIEMSGQESLHLSCQPAVRTLPHLDILLYIMLLFSSKHLTLIEMPSRGICWITFLAAMWASHQVSAFLGNSAAPYNSLSRLAGINIPHPRKSIGHEFATGLPQDMVGNKMLFWSKTRFIPQVLFKVLILWKQRVRFGKNMVPLGICALGQRTILFHAREYEVDISTNVVRADGFF